MSSEKPSDPEKETESLSSSSSSSAITAGLDALAHYISEKLHIEDIKKTPKVLNDTTIDGIVEYILSGNCKNIITMVGAGISTSAGIPDFRSPGSGLYDNLQKYDLPCPEAIFTLDYFHVDAKPFFALAKELYPGTFKPTLSHYFIKLLEIKNLLLRHYTQNIDTLERVANISSEKLVEAHGTFHVGHCLGCKKAYTQDWMKEKIFKDEIPTCTDCPGVVKPDIVFFGENLPMKFYKCTQQDFKKCDLLIIMGSTLAVQPFASLVYRVKSSCPRLLINRERAGELQFDSPKNVRDVLMLGDCDKQCQILADKLGWGEELKKLMNDEHARIEEEEKMAKECKKATPSKI